MPADTSAPLPFLKRLREPATFWTDCALAAWSGWLAFALARHASASCPVATAWWIGAFATSAVAAVAGAIHHGLGHEFRPAVNQAIWQLALLSLVGTGLCLLQAAANIALTGSTLTTARIAAWLITAAFAVAVVRIDKFYAAICAYGLGQVAVLVAALAARTHFPAAHLLWIAAGFALSLIAAAVQHFRIGFSERFNHNDLYHVVQFAAQGCFYLGAAAALENGL